MQSREQKRPRYSFPSARIDLSRFKIQPEISKLEKRIIPWENKGKRSKILSFVREYQPEERYIGEKENTGYIRVRFGEN